MRRVSVSPQLCGYISDIASNMMLVEEHILWMAQNEARACTRIVQCVERIADLALAADNRAISKVTGTSAHLSPVPQLHLFYFVLWSPE